MIVLRNNSLKSYIEKLILRYYPKFDPAHNLEHVRGVISRGFRYASELHRKDLNPDIIYTSCALHDIGLVGDRKNHELFGGKMIRDDKNLRKWFTEEEIETIAQAVEDHRASLSGMPRSIYGRIVSEADRNDPKTIEELFERSVKYNRSKYPQESKEKLMNRVVDYMYSKYGPGGYALKKIYLDIPEVRERNRRVSGFFKDRKKVEKVVSDLIEKYSLTVYIMFGCPGSGKSTWISTNLPPDFPIVSRDIIREDLGMTSGGRKVVGSKVQEEKVSRTEDRQVLDNIHKRRSFVIDNTGLGKYAAQSIRRTIALGRSQGYRVIGVIVKAPLDTIIERRRRDIPVDVLRGMYEKAENLDLKEFGLDEIIEVRQ